MIPPDADWVGVESSNVLALCWVATDPEGLTGELWVRFHKNGRQTAQGHYADVPMGVYESVLNAGSVGQALIIQVKGSPTRKDGSQQHAPTYSWNPA